ncbi:hypothetical protein [Methylococcus sp. EFPC2]|uniref:hypothetical protein n=1 Tax=Methylococcus sp. EFPC2 TaxID=2812648 RepID=UPI001967A909|nr:hypothetical protein [Methylococcus sp. EFPC2]QSA98406.1 hypothetical protein JWZ97_06250 [Methylococcus sp. EFPC2]
MSITPILSPLNSERILQLSPADATAAAVTWLRRPNLFPGRALTAPTLEARQRWAAGRVVQRAQAFTAGVVNGLEVGYAVTPRSGEATRDRVVLHLSGGRGLAVSGEDVWLPRGIEVDFHALPVVAPPDVFDPEAAPGDDTPPGGLRARAIGPTLGELLAVNPGVLPPAGILVLQPVSVDRADLDPNDPCDRCGCAEENVSFEDWRLADAVRLLWYAWPTEYYGLPGAAAGRLRNALAYTVFEAERALPPDAGLPWEQFGVPVALISVNADYVPVFADRSAVVRQGGRAQASRLQRDTASPSTLAPHPRLALLWQARIEQFAEQIAEFDAVAPDPAVLAASFRHLPPVGLLPANAYDLASRTSAFFPAGFDIDAVPVPYEQLDLAVRESASLAPLDFSLGERLRILVPVSQASYEPRLLLTEAIDPEFQQTLNRFLTARARRLGQRQSLRHKIAVLQRAVDARPTAVPAISDDALALEPEDLSPWGPPPPGGGHRSILASGIHQHYFRSASATLTPGTGETLYAWVYLDPDTPPRTLMLQWNSDDWEHRAYWGENLIDWGGDGSASRRFMGALPPSGQWLRLEVPAVAVGLGGTAISGMAFTLYDGRAAYGSSGFLNADDNEEVWFSNALPAGAQALGDYAWEFLTENELWGPFEAAYGVELVAGPATAPPPPAGRSAVLADLVADADFAATLSDAELAQLPARGVEGFIAYLKTRADRADDIVDFNFVKVQTDIYRLRQLVLNTTAATRFAVSPVLADIAKAETATATRERISSFFNELRATPSTPGTPSVELRAMTAAATAAPVVGLAPVVGAAPRAVDSGVSSLAATRAGSTFTGIRAGAFLDTEITPIRRPIGPMIGPIRFDTSDVVNTQPVVGKADIRTMSIADRLQEPPANNTRNYAAASRHEAVMSLIRLADELAAEDGGVTPGLFENIDVYGLADDSFLPTNGTDPVARRRRPLSYFLSIQTRVTALSGLINPPVRQNADESAHFSDATGMGDNTVALLRQVEGRIKRYRDIIARCETALATLRADLNGARSRTTAVDDELAEARHDVAVTRALISEEQSRLDAINARRAAVLAGEVRFLAYLRPRTLEHLGGAPLRNLDPGLVEAPVPACLRTHADIPDELEAMLAVVREAPASWFIRTPGLLDRLDRVDVLVKAVQSAQWRSQLSAQRSGLSTVSAAAGAGLVAQAIGKTRIKQLQTVNLARSATLAIDIAQLSVLGWKAVRETAVHVVSLGDLIAGEHGRGQVARQTAEFFDQLSGICTCLHAEFSGVPPSIRLDWAEILSEFDTAPNLRNLASLTRWSELDYRDRKQMQAYVDWLFGQVATNEPRATALINDVVRMCLLLASHAPVGRVIAGRLPRPVTARPGLRIPLLALEPAKMRVGMQALIYRADQVVARAVLEDVGGKELSAKVVHTAAASVDLDETVRVQFSEAVTIAYSTRAARVLPM